MGIFSCQKELTLDGNNSNSGNGNTIPGSTNGDLLIKSYGKVQNSPDSNVIYYSYNASKQLTAMRIITFTSSANSSTNSWTGFERNAAGLIVRKKQYIVSSMLPIPADTAIFDYYYTTGVNPQIKYSISTVSLFGFSTTDSTIYTYNSSGKVTLATHYMSSLLTGGYDLSQKYLYSYDAAGNWIKLEQNSVVGGVMTLINTTTFTYDSKTNPLNYTEAEAIAISDGPATSQNTTSSKSVSSVAGTLQVNIAINYNTAGKPATAKQTQSFSGATTITDITFYYQ